MKIFFNIIHKPYFCNAIAMNMKKIFTSVVLALCFVACQQEVTPQHDTPSGKIKVSIGQTLSIKSRTSIGDDGHSAIWSAGDKIALWAESRSGNFAMQAEPFALYHFSESYDTAVFSAFINPMEEGEYTYYATYPIPNSINGTKATYTIAAEQQGDTFVGDCDIMVSNPVTARELAEGVVNDLNFRFAHKMHALRITMPGDGTMNGYPIDCIEFTFPTEVTGDVVVDVANPSAPATLVNGSKNLKVNIPAGYKEGDTVWAMIFPTKLTGEISYRVHASGYKSVYKSVSISKTAQESHISPMSFAVPGLSYVTDLYINVTDNMLGEDYNSITIYDMSGNKLQSHSANSSHTYYATSVNGQIDSSSLSGTQYRVVYESDNAIVEDVVTVSNITPYRNNSVASKVPYLLFEDFSSIHTTHANCGDDDSSYGDDREQPGESLNNYMGSQGWSAARFMVSAGNCVRINVRYQMVKILFSFTTTHRGRLDTPLLNGLKSGSTVKLKVQFDAGAHVAVGSSMDFTGQDCTSISVSTHTNAASAIDGVATGTAESGSLADFGETHFTKFLPDSYAINSWTSAYPTFSISVPNVTNAHRLCFYADTSASIDGIGNEEFFIYIDNIKVSIDK